MTTVQKNHRMFEQVLHQIREYITSCNLVAGDKLMTERELASFLQVSRSSVREALRILEMFDVIHSKPGEGTVLKTPHIPKILTNMLPFFTIPTEHPLNYWNPGRCLRAVLLNWRQNAEKTRHPFNARRHGADGCSC